MRAVGSISAEVDEGESLSVRSWVSRELIIRREDALVGTTLCLAVEHRDKAQVVLIALPSTS